MEVPHKHFLNNDLMSWQLWIDGMRVAMRNVVEVTLEDKEYLMVNKEFSMSMRPIGGKK
jgi:hypothetical protein